MFDPDELRIINISAPVFIKMLRTREKRIIDRITGEFRNGRTDFLALVAELVSVRDQMNEITNALRMQDAQEGEE